MVNLAILFLILINVILSYQGFNKGEFRERYLFHVGSIRWKKDYLRLLSSGFFHADWMHLLFNMYALYVFGEVLEWVMTLPVFLLLYVGSLLGGNLLALYIHRNHDDYRALGASGAVSGIVFACIALLPDIKVFFGIPGWLFAIAYTLISIYGIKSRKGNIGHEAHLGGSIVGILLAILYRPVILSLHPWILLAITLPMIVFLYLLVARPEFLLIPNYVKYESEQLRNHFKSKAAPTSGRKAITKAGKKRFLNPEAELNSLLEKVQKEGYEQLSSAEKDRLEQLSKELGD